jgi:hypothetical protein
VKIGGNTSRIYFIILDVCMILTASIALDICDPAALLKDDDKHINNGELFDEYVATPSVYSQMDEPEMEEPQMEKPRMEKEGLGDWYPQI